MKSAMKELIECLKEDEALKRVIAMDEYGESYESLYPIDRNLKVHALEKKIIYLLHKCVELSGGDLDG